MAEITYPEHDKLRVIQRDSHTIGEFIEWLGENGYYICERRDAETATPKRYISVPEEGSRGFEKLGLAFIQCLEMVADNACIYWPTTKRLPRDLLAQYFQIDENKLEDEKLKMLDVLRARHESKEVKS